MVSIARSTGQGQGSAVTLSGMADKPTTGYLAQGLGLYQEGVNKKLAQQALKKQEALAKISSAKKNANEFYLGDLADESNRLYDDLFTEVNAGNITPDQLIQELDNVTAQVETFHRQDDAVRDFVEIREGQEIFNPETGEYEDVAIYMQDFTVGNNRFGEEFVPDMMSKIASSGERGVILDPQSLRQQAVEKTRQTSAQEDISLVGAQGGQNIFQTEITFDPIQVKAEFMSNPATLESAADRVAKRNGISRFQARLLPETQEEMEAMWAESQPVTKQQQTTRAEKSPESKTKGVTFTGNGGQNKYFNFNLLTGTRGDDFREVGIDPRTNQRATADLFDEEGNEKSYIISSIVVDRNGNLVGAKVTDKDKETEGRKIEDERNLNKIISRLQIEGIDLARLAGYTNQPTQEETETQKEVINW